jgi:hypothetical protein
LGFGLGGSCALMCEGVWSYKKVFACFFRKLKASSTNWLIWIIASRLCSANISSRKCQIRNHHTLKRPLFNHGSPDGWIWIFQIYVSEMLYLYVFSRTKPWKCQNSLTPPLKKLRSVKNILRSTGKQLL